MFGVRAGSDDTADEVTNQCAHGNGCREENGSLYSIDGAVSVKSSGGGTNLNLFLGFRGLSAARAGIAAAC